MADKPFNSSDAQKSEVHATTADADGSPTAHGDAATTFQQHRRRKSQTRPAVIPEPPSDSKIVRDDTDIGGPLVIQSDDPDLNPPRVPQDPFPTDGTPEIDPKIEK